MGFTANNCEALKDELLKRNSSDHCAAIFCYGVNPREDRGETVGERMSHVLQVVQQSAEEAHWDGSLTGNFRIQGGEECSESKQVIVVANVHDLSEFIGRFWDDVADPTEQTCLESVKLPRQIPTLQCGYTGYKVFEFRAKRPHPALGKTAAQTRECV